MGNYHIRFGGEGSETWHGNVLRHTALTPLRHSGIHGGSPERACPSGRSLGLCPLG